jgi:hypothetical protein
MGGDFQWIPYGRIEEGGASIAVLWWDFYNYRTDRIRHMAGPHDPVPTAQHLRLMRAPPYSYLEEKTPHAAATALSDAVS